MKKKIKQVTIPTMGIYARVSSHQSLKGLSLQDQINRGIEQANALGWKYEIFKEGAVTGKLSYTERPQLNKLVNEILADEIQALFCVDLDRLSRDVNDGQYLISFLIENEIKLFDVKGEIDIQDENQELISRIRNIFASLEAKKIFLRMNPCSITRAKHHIQISKLKKIKVELRRQAVESDDDHLVDNTEQSSEIASTVN